MKDPRVGPPPKSNVIQFTPRGHTPRPTEDPPEMVDRPLNQDEFTLWKEVEFAHFITHIGLLDDECETPEEFWPRARILQALINSWPFPSEDGP